MLSMFRGDKSRRVCERRADGKFILIEWNKFLLMTIRLGKIICRGAVPVLCCGYSSCVYVRA